MLAEAELVRAEAEQQLAAAREVSASAAAAVEALRQKEAAAAEAITMAGVQAAAAEESERQLQKEHAERQQRCGALLSSHGSSVLAQLTNLFSTLPCSVLGNPVPQGGGTLRRCLFARAGKFLFVFVGDLINRVTRILMTLQYVYGVSGKYWYGVSGNQSAIWKRCSDIETWCSRIDHIGRLTTM